MTEPESVRRPLRVLVAHNLYRSLTPSGENQVVQAQVAALDRAGVQVRALLPSSDELPTLGVPARLATVLSPVANPVGVRAFTRALEEFGPDVVHVHNTVPLLSPWIVRTARRHGVRVVSTVHNFRLDCASGTYFRDGRVCTDCQGTRLAVPAVRHSCYRGSRLQTSAVAAGRAVHRSTWRGVDRFIALTDFHRDFLVSLGVDAGQVRVLPTASPGPAAVTSPGQDLLFLGRLSPEKGISMLLSAWRAGSLRRHRRLLVAGSGELQHEVERAAAEDPSIVSLGPLGRAAVAEQLEQCAAVLLPSQWFEGSPVVLAEAMAHGRPVVCSDLGGLASAVDDTVGWAVPARQEAWTAALDALTDAELARRGRAARLRWESRLRPEVVLGQQINLYQELLT